MSRWFLKLWRVGMLARLAILASILTALGSSTALAHDPGLSAAEVRIFDDRIVAEISFSPLDLRDVQIDQTLLTLHDNQGQIAVRSFVRKSSDQNSVHFLLEFASSTADQLRISAPVLANLPRGHKQFCSVYDRENRLLAERMFTADTSDLSVDLQPGPPGIKSMFSFLVLGVEHILTGYDHLAFLVALLLAGGSLRRNAKIVTSFTVAHSLTLALATLGLVNISPAIVEPVIAASIVFVGLENLSGRRVAARWLVTFAFGLVHGLGFASALRELGIGGLGARAALPLLSFNLGVELAQIAIAALVLPVVWKLEQRPGFGKHAHAVSLLITFAGLYWFLTRTLL